MKYKKGEFTEHLDYLNNQLFVGSMVIYAPFTKERTFTLETGTIIAYSPQKLKVRRLGRINSWIWVYPTACVDLKFINKPE